MDDTCTCGHSDLYDHPPVPYGSGDYKTPCLLCPCTRFTPALDSCPCGAVGDPQSIAEHIASRVCPEG